MKTLTKKQEQVLQYLQDEIRRTKYPPTVREVCRAFDLKSSSSAHFHLNALEKKGYIKRDATKPRAIEILVPFYDELNESSSIQNIPVVGEVTAGKPILASDNIEGYFPLPLEYFPGSKESFMLRVKGNSMSNAGIWEGDYILVKQQSDADNGDIVVALLEDEATVKRLFKKNGTIELRPENEAYQSITSSEVVILGVVAGLFRKI